jgi:aminoglycoside phosphotransferase
LLGHGGEGWIYEYGNDALKIYVRNSDKQYLKNIQLFQSNLKKQHFTFDIPQIYEIGEVDGILYTIEKRLQGVQMDKKIIGMSTPDRQKLYRSYYDAIRQVNAVTFSNLPYGQIIKTPESITSDSWTDFLVRVLDQKMVKTQDKMRLSVSDFDKKINLFKLLIQKHLVSTQKNLVHCDYFLNNVLVNDDLAISAVLDFSVHAAVGDPRLDIAGVLTWNGIDPNIKPEDYTFLYAIAKKDYGDDVSRFADLYLLYSSFYFSDMDDPSFSIKNLNNEKLWSKYR